MIFRARNCHLSISLNPALIKYEDEYEFFSKIGDEFVCETESDDSTVESESIQIDLPANLGVQVIVDQVELSITNASGSIQLELNDCKALLVNFTGNLSIIRTSPDHGTAYNLRGSKNISDKSFLNCYKLIKKIYKNRIINDKF